MVSTVSAREETRAARRRVEETRGDGEREREPNGVRSFANMNVLSVAAAPCQERTRLANMPG